MTLCSLCLILAAATLTRQALADYYTSVENLDRTIGDVVESLDRHGYGDNTLIIYTTDHGPNFAFAKWCLYDEGIRTPFIARWNGVIEPGTTTDAMISHADIVRTIIEAAGGTAPTDSRKEDGSGWLFTRSGEGYERSTSRSSSWRAGLKAPKALSPS